MVCTARRHTEERQCLDDNVQHLENTCTELRAMLLMETTVNTTESTQRQEKVEALEVELARCRVDYSSLEQKMKHMVETPLGFRKRVHGLKMKCIGYAKRRKTMLRAQIQPTIVTSVQESNKWDGRKRRLGGEGDLQSKTAEAIASILSAGEVVALAEQPKMSQATIAAAKAIFKKISDSLTEDVMLGACDGSGVTHRLYAMIYKTVKQRVGLVAPTFNGSLLPSPNRLAQLRKQMNDKLPQFIGDYYSIEGCRVIPAIRIGKKIVAPEKEVILNSKNNLFVDLEVVQQSMVLFYDITVAGNVTTSNPQNLDCLQSL